VGFEEELLVETMEETEVMPVERPAVRQRRKERSDFRAFVAHVRSISAPRVRLK
jgi:hypothetical protein